MVYVLAALHAEVLPRSRQQCKSLAEGPLEELHLLEQTISTYVSQTLDAPDDSVSASSVAA